MALSKYRLGDLLELLEHTNQDLRYSVEDVRGVNNLKQLMTTKADLNGRDLSKFQIVNPGEFVFNHRTSRNGEKFSIAYNDCGKTVICTEDYVVFRVKPESEKVLNAYWLYMYFNRPEFDRYVITNSWGSSTEFYNWEDLCSIELNLPGFETQVQYVNIYRSMVANQQSYERGLEDLKIVLDAQIDNVKHTAPRKLVSELLREVNNRNSDGEINSVQGINILKRFMPSIADVNGVDLKKYKLVGEGQFAFSGMQTGRDECIRIALCDTEEPVIISPAYTVFEVNKKSVIPEYIMIWFLRRETDRRGWFMSDSSIRTNLDLDRFFEIEIPIPEEKVQQSIVELYAVYIARRRISDRLKMQIQDICPILIKGPLTESVREK